MIAGRGDLEGAAGGLHAADVGEVGVVLGDRGGGGAGGSEGLGAAEMVDEGEEVGGGEHDERAGPGGLAALGGRADQADAARPGRHRGGEDAGDGGDAAVERELAEGGEFGGLLAGEHVHGGQDGERDREVEVAAFLEQVGGGEIDEDALGRERQAHGGEGGTDALAGFADGFVGQADDEEGGEAGGNLDLELRQGWLRCR